jgi:apolipoprotein N-acyltransferase
LTVAVVLGLTLAYGWYRLAAPESREHLRVALVQANVLVRDRMPRADQVQHLRAYERLTREAASQKPALIVWPSSSLPAPLSSSLVVRFATRRLAQATGAYLLVGGAGHDKETPPKEGYESFSNSEFLLAPSGRLVGQYNKIRLLPFNEYLPLQGILTWPRWITTLSASFVPGEEYTLFQVAGAKFGTPICWENMFPTLFRRFVKEGAQFMIGVTDEGFFGSTPAPYLQSLAMYAFRAVENRVAVVRSASTGVSAFISPTGAIVERVGDGHGNGLFVPGSLVRDVPLAQQKTFYTVYGDVFVYVVSGIAAVIIVVVWYTQPRFPSRLETS